MKVFTRVSYCALVSASVLALVAGPVRALTTGHTGSGRPALALQAGRIYVGWAGSTGAAATKQLILGWSSEAGRNINKIGNGERIPEGTGPALDADPGGPGVYVAWPAGDNGNTLTAAYTDGTTLICRTRFTGVTTAHAPALARDRDGVRHLAWTDGAGRLNIGRLDATGCASTHTMALTDRVTTTATAVSGPALAYDSSGSSNLGLLLAWTRADRTVNIGSYVPGAPGLILRSTADSPVGAAGAPGLAASTADLYTSYAGTDGNLYLGYSEGCIPTCFHPIPIGPRTTSGVGMTSEGQGTVWYSYFDPTAHLVLSRL